MIRLDDITKTYLRGREKVEALKHVSLSINKGEFAVIFGPSGGGKSTLLHLIGGIDKPSFGNIEVGGQVISRFNENQLTQFRRDNIGFIFQFYNLLPSINAAENVALALIAKGTRRQAALKEANRLLEKLGLGDRADHLPSQLSGGEQQRVAIARAVAASPSVVLADEPTGDLDSQSAEDVFALLRAINSEYGASVVMATHNERFIPRAQRLFELTSGELHEIPVG